MRRRRSTRIFRGDLGFFESCTNFHRLISLLVSTTRTATLPCGTPLACLHCASGDGRRMCRGRQMPCWGACTMGWNSQGAKRRSYSLRHRGGVGPLGRRLQVEPLEERAMLSVTADANAKIVSNLYADVLGRLAAPSEVDYWRGQLAAGQPQDSVVVGVVLSTEHRSNVVQGLYHDYLGRGTDPGGEAYWVNVLGQGVSELQLLALIVGSDEYYRNHGGDEAGVIRVLYHDVLQRPDPPGPSEIAYWHGVLESGRSRASAAEGFINSPEFIGVGVGVDEMYRDFLRRDADAGGRAYWINQFQH